MQGGAATLGRRMREGLAAIAMPRRPSLSEEPLSGASQTVRQLLFSRVVLVTIISACLFAAVMIVTVRLEQRRAHEEKIVSRLQDHASIIRASLSDYDYATIDNLVGFIGPDAEISLFRIYNSHEIVIAEYAEDDAGSRDTPFVRQLTDPVSGAFLGRVEFRYRQSGSVPRDMIFIGLTAGFCILFFASFGSWIFRVVNAAVGQPLRLIHDHISQSDSTNWVGISIEGPREVRLLNDELNSLAEKLVSVARTDELTGLLNRRAMQQDLRDIVTDAHADAGEVAIFFIDMDHFKRINDHFGHGVGDTVLRKVAHILVEELDDRFRIYRLGGDEFLVVLPKPDRRTITSAASSLAAALRGEVTIEGMRHHFSASIGIATLPGDARECGDLLRCADIALYRAKGSGRNRYVYYDASQFSDNSMWIRVSDSLRRAHEQPLLLHAFQDIRHVGHPAPWGAESLLRLLDPADGRPFRADEVVRIAHELGLQNLLTRYTIANALEWLREQPGGTHVTVNLSARQLVESHRAGTLRRQVEGSGFDPSRIIVELTEDHLLHDVDLAAAIRAEAAYGFTIALDDFGSGFSALRCLTELPVAIVKLDKSLVADLHSSPKSRALFYGLVKIAHSLDLRIIAEGIETREHMEEARIAGCDLVQGYFIGRPQLRSQVMG
ncbi:MAG: EAL domain-containing protein [Geminicoccaceae bacterium]